MHFLILGNKCFEWNVFWKVQEKWNFESWKTLEFCLCKSWKKHFNVCTNPGCSSHLDFH